ncbi:MAG: hypothetical protein AAGE59_37225 [Cyanobacteria bacterium P01_F01_bin.86]
MKHITLLPTLIFTILLAACSGTNNSVTNETRPGTGTTSEAQAVPAIEEAEAVVSGETPVSVQWELCVPSGTFPGDTYPSNTNAAGCRHNGNSDITVWPMADGSVEVYYVRNKLSPASLPGSTREPYQLATKSRGCSPDGPGEEGFYEARKVTSIESGWAGDRKFIQIEDVTLTPATVPDESNDTIGGFLFLQGDCDVIDPDRVF